MAVAIKGIPKSSGGIVHSLVKMITKRVAVQPAPIRANIRGLTKRGRPRPLEDK